MVTILIYSIILLEVSLIHDSISAPMIHKVDHSETNMQGCQRSMTYEEIRHLVAHSPCASNSDRKFRIKRDDNPNSINNVYALQSTINDHRTIIDDHRKMINYLINNTVNITQLNDYYAEKHTNTTPLWKSWRDVGLILLISICICAILYFLAVRFHPVDALSSALYRCLHNKQQQQQKNKSINDKGAMRQNHKDLQPPMVSTVEREYIRYDRDSNSSY